MLFNFIKLSVMLELQTNIEPYLINSNTYWGNEWNQRDNTNIMEVVEVGKWFLNGLFA